MASPAAAAPGLEFAGFGTKPYRAYVLGALLTVYTFNFIDRVVVGVIQEPIKQEFGLTDLQLGLLGGPAFAVLYTFLGIPIARLAERKSRVAIVALALAVWSGMTALCGVVTSYAFLLLARVGVSVGEAGCTPPAQSLIGDYFPSDKRATALSIYALGVPVGSMLAAVGGGLIAEYMGWREAFLVLGLPGLILALVLRLTVKEPPRAAPAAETPSFGAAIRILAAKPTFWHVALGGAIASFVGYGVGQYLNSFLIRSHGLTLLQASQLTGVVLGVFAAFGTFLSGWLADRLSRRYPNALAWLPALGFLICTPLYVAGYLIPNLWIGIPLLALGAVTHYFYLGPMYAATQGIVPPRMRATAVAVLLFIVNILGYGLGPPAIGLLSDVMAGVALRAGAVSAEAAAAEGLRHAMIIGLAGYLWAALHFLLAWRTLRRDWA